MECRCRGCKAGRPHVPLSVRQEESVKAWLEGRVNASSQRYASVERLIQTHRDAHALARRALRSIQRAERRARPRRDPESTIHFAAFCVEVVGPEDVELVHEYAHELLETMMEDLRSGRYSEGGGP